MGRTQSRREDSARGRATARGGGGRPQAPRRWAARAGSVGAPLRTWPKLPGLGEGCANRLFTLRGDAIMVRRVSAVAQEVLVGTFGFDPDEAVSHFLVHIPTGAQQPVEISEHLSWEPDRIATATHYGEKADGQVRSRLDRAKWNAVADVIRAEFNARLKKEGCRPGRWKIGHNLVSRT